jgi:hypothetical protein
MKYCDVLLKFVIFFRGDNFDLSNRGSKSLAMPVVTSWKTLIFIIN